MPSPRAAAGAAFSRGKLYVMGGVGPSGLARLGARVRPGESGAGGRSPGPTPREHLGVTAARGRVFVVAGRTAGFDTNLDLVEAYSPATGRWTKLPPVPGRRGGTRRDLDRPLRRLGRRRGERGHDQGGLRPRPEHEPLAPPAGPADPAPRPRRRATRTAASTSSRAARRRGSRSAPRTSTCRCAERRQPARDEPSAADLVDDVDRVVLAVGAREAEEDREPADEAEPPSCASGRVKTSSRPRSSKSRPAPAGRR